MTPVTGYGGYSVFGNTLSRTWSTMVNRNEILPSNASTTHVKPPENYCHRRTLTEADGAQTIALETVLDAD